MMFPDDNQEIADFGLICPECGTANPDNTEYCIFCDKNLSEIVLFLEDDSFDLEITKNCLIEYRKTFWGDSRTGKVIKYPLKEISNIEFGSPITRLKFDFNGKRQVLPLREENMESLKALLSKIID
ncbi:hypothetical protein [Methanobacterium petrolearium]|uniref:hypothetical protein n=1 Tax=Methanobacterium petrolearium TaxID=710190 RepID=UPI001AE17E22|nr:hypothetical protein [Methanobacterium petrolearium]MBP1945392.1 hypothetical protein [Methanobacterium petrolearium]BDZ71585.1 hypothetical protein GCM10025861_21020 [Methanobacterium petrolearium]